MNLRTNKEKDERDRMDSVFCPLGPFEVIA
jgi:hypothetical protein